MPPAEAATVLGLLADGDRLTVVAALALGARTVAEVALAAGLDGRTAGRSLARLATGGLVEVLRDGGYRLAVKVFGEARATAPRSEDAGVESRLGGEAGKVLRTFVRDGRLVAIPVPRAKRLVVVDYLAGEFELGVAYPEKEVNARLRAFHDDVAALRR